MVLAYEPVQEVLREMRGALRGRCRWGALAEEEFEDVLMCTAPWKACGVDSVYSFPIKKCPPIRKAVFEPVKMFEWSVTDSWDEENSWLLEGRTVLIYKGGDRKDPANYRPITCLPTITKMVTLAIHKRMRGLLFWSVDRASLNVNSGASGPPMDARRLCWRTLQQTLCGRKKRRMWWSCTATSKRLPTTLTTTIRASRWTLWFSDWRPMPYRREDGYAVEDPPVVRSEEGSWGCSPDERHHPRRRLLTPAVCPDDRPLIKVIKRRVGDRTEVLDCMDDLKASVADVGIVRTVHGIVKSTHFLLAW